MWRPTGQAGPGSSLSLGQADTSPPCQYHVTHRPGTTEYQDNKIYRIHPCWIIKLCSYSQSIQGYCSFQTFQCWSKIKVFSEILRWIHWIGSWRRNRLAASRWVIRVDTNIFLDNNSHFITSSSSTLQQQQPQVRTKHL